MSRILPFIVFSLLMAVEGQAQTSAQNGTPQYAYYPPSRDKQSWQRLNLLLSSTFINVVHEGQVDLDTSLLLASRSLGLSRFSMLAEGINDPGLFEQSGWIDRRDPGYGIRLLSKATGRKRLELLILLGAYYAFEPGGYQQKRDSVDYFLTRAIQESKLLKEERLGRQALCLQGKIYVQLNDSRGDSIFTHLINQCGEAGDKETEARALVYRSRYTPPMAATIQKKTEDSQRAADIYHSLGNTEGEINALTDAGYLITITGQLQSAKEVFLKALNLAESIHFPYTHYNFQTLSMITTFQGKFGEPLRYTLQMIKIAENCRDSIGWGYLYSNLALMLKSEGRIQESLDITQKAIKRFIIDRNPTVYNMLIDVNNKMAEEGRAKEALELTLEISKKVNPPATFSDQFVYHDAFANCYLHLNQLGLAEMHLRKMDSLETLAEKITGPLRRSEVNELTGLILMKRGQYLKARSYFEKHFTVPSMVTRNLPGDLNAYRSLLTIDSALGDNVRTIAHYKKYTALLDSSFKVTKIRQAEELQVMYQMQEKESQIALLTQQANIEKANSKQAALQKNVTIAGIIAVMVIAGLLYRQNRLKQRNNEVITRKNKQLQELLDVQAQLIKDKEWLLKEIHHRVKNNLQIVMSLLNSQSVYINNDAALTAIHDSERRVHAMALIHQKLYQSENISQIAMVEYIDELVSYVHDSFDIGNRVVFEQFIEPMNLDVSQAIPLGLIINEGIVNAIKYAFPNERKGIITINLHNDGPGYLLLEISDNGIGLPPGLNIKQLNSLGLDMIQGLTKQLNGKFYIENNNGLHIKVGFVALNRELVS
ncbi:MULTISPECIES: sensor histidine kinase [Niastella]|uniref:histidine kinase n=1 Tax=Niastella soli TaxID=2821487 RepID=A0ABS3YXS7_9BACT|nr:sensor histidine kinase [Niastella soli]MBO9201956.1 sensor histidine kinase [Niastella soli]